MKHLKTFEANNFDNYIGKLFIVFPSTEYFKSDIQFQIIFVDSVNIENIIGEDVYNIKSENVIQFNQYINSGEESLNYTIVWNDYYSKENFDDIKFMTVKEFYNKYESSYIRILDDILDELDTKRWSDKTRTKLNRILDKLIIPEVEHIINAKKFNI